MLGISYDENELPGGVILFSIKSYQVILEIKFKEVGPRKRIVRNNDEEYVLLYNGQCVYLMNLNSMVLHTLSENYDNPENVMKIGQSSQLSIWRTY